MAAAGNAPTRIGGPGVSVLVAIGVTVPRSQFSTAAIGVTVPARLSAT